MLTTPLPLLVVDDDATNRDLLARRLERRGFTTACADSGQAALDYLGRHPVATVLLDVQMPGMSGLEVLHEIRRQWPASQLPVLMVTAKDQSDDVVTALDLGANDYITKPIDFPVALARIRTQLSRKDAEDRLRASEERYALAAKGANDGLWDWDLTTGQVHYSSRWRDIIGCGEEEELGHGPDAWFGRVHSEDLPRLQRDLDAHFAGRTPHFENEHRMRHSSGAFRWVLTRGLAIRDKDGRPTRMAGSQSDITDGKVVDALTALPNRTLLLDRLERVLHHYRLHTAGRFAVLFLDLDGFKLINDSLGHQAGDELLQIVARRMEGSLRTSDMIVRAPTERGTDPVEHTLARLGGDEFVILLHEVRDVVDATRVAERIQRVFTRPFDLAGRKVFLSASIGIAVGSSAYATPEDVLRDADTAMYRAKALGSGRSEVFDSSMREQVVQRLQLDTALRLGLERHEFVPYYQPIIDLKAGTLAGFEALIRWRHPERGIVSPIEFIPVIEENGLVVPIGRQFFDQVCQQLRLWRASYPQAHAIRINVNFAGQQFLEAGLIDSLLEMIDDAGVEPRQLVVEITESSAIRNLEQVVQVLTRLRESGMRVVLDDFGTGYSSLSCLHELPISGLKLDRSFIVREQRTPAILKAMVMLAEHLGLSVTAEGIETAAQCAHLKELGCDFAQGYLFSRPVDAETATRFLQETGSWLPAEASPLAWTV